MKEKARALADFMVSHKEAEVVHHALRKKKIKSGLVYQD